MLVSRLLMVVLGVSVLALSSVSCEAETPSIQRVVVAVLEPTPEQGGDALSYTVSIGSDRLFTGDEVLNHLAEEAGDYLVIMAREDVAASSILSIAALASKAGFLHYAVFIFDQDRRGMVEMPSFKWTEFSTDPKSVEPLLR